MTFPVPSALDENWAFAELNRVVEILLSTLPQSLGLL